MLTLGRRQGAIALSEHVRLLATKPQKKPEAKPVDEKAKEAAMKKKKEKGSWSNKSGEKEADKSTDFFIKLMLNQEKRYAAAKKVQRSKTRTLWEKLVAMRYQREMSRQNNRMDFALHSAMRIRDHAIAALPTEELRLEALRGSYRPYRSTPIYRRAATWTPPLPQLPEDPNKGK